MEQLKKDFIEIKGKYQEALILFRCGSFYRAICDDAHAIARVMERPEDDIYEIAGVDAISFRFDQLDRYLPKLVRAGYRVAIADSDINE